MNESTKVALFRAAADARATEAKLAARGFGAVLAPVTEIAGLAAAAPPGDFDFVVAASAKAFAFGAQAARGLPLYVVGEKTAAAARAAGLAPAPPADDIAALLPLLPPGRALYLAGLDRKPDLEAALGARVTTLIVYEARARLAWSAEEARAVEGAAAALHYSRRGAALAAELAARAGIAARFRRTPQVCLSRDVAAALADIGAARTLWPRRPQEEALFDVLETALAEG